MKEFIGLGQPSTNATTSKSKKKRRPEEIEEIVIICGEIIDQFMEFEGNHFRNYCLGENEGLTKNSTLEFLLDSFDILGTTLIG